MHALAVSGTGLYVGGDFSRTVDSAETLRGIATFSGGAWSALSNDGLDNADEVGNSRPASVFALAASGNDLYVGGNFTQSGDGTVKNLT